MVPYRDSDVFECTASPTGIGLECICPRCKVSGRFDVRGSLGSTGQNNQPCGPLGSTGQNNHPRGSTIGGFVRDVYFGRGAGDKEPFQPQAKRTYEYTTPLPVRILKLSAQDSDDLWITSVRVGVVECVLQECPQSFLGEIFPWGELLLLPGQAIFITVENRSQEPQVFDGRMMLQEIVS